MVQTSQVSYKSLASWVQGEILRQAMLDRPSSPPLICDPSYQKVPQGSLWQNQDFSLHFQNIFLALK